MGCVGTALASRSRKPSRDRKTNVKIILLGVSGMVDSAALRVVLDAVDVEAVLSISRRECGITHPKLRELIVPDLFDFADVENQLVGYDACIWTVGISSVGLNEAAYAHITQELTLRWAHALLRLNSGMPFRYCSADGAWGTAMWARVRQRVERELESMPFRHAGVVRPSIIRPGPGIHSRTWSYQLGMLLLKPIFLLTPLLARAFPNLITTSEALGLAMLRATQGHAQQLILESVDINRLGYVGKV